MRVSGRVQARVQAGRRAPAHPRTPAQSASRTPEKNMWRSSMKLSVNVSGLAGLQQAVEQMSARRLSAALATGLTRTAVEVKAVLADHLARDLDRPTPYTLRSLYMRPARADQLQAEVYIKDDLAGSGTPATKYLLPQIEGGARHVKRFERALQAAGVMPAGWHAVPGAAARLDSYGNVSKGQIAQILSQVGTELTAGYNRTLPRGTDKASRTKQRRAYGRAGGQFVAIREQRGRLKPGIYIAEARDFGAKLGLGRTGKLRPVFLFVRSTQYRPRFDFWGVAQRTADQRLRPNIERAVSEQLARMGAAGTQQSFGGF
jgi:hypothetical protein